jgi:hypothetical protein
LSSTITSTATSTFVGIASGHFQLMLLLGLCLSNFDDEPAFYN